MQSCALQHDGEALPGLCQWQTAHGTAHGLRHETKTLLERLSGAHLSLGYPLEEPGGELGVGLPRMHSSGDQFADEVMPVLEDELSEARFAVG